MTETVNDHHARFSSPFGEGRSIHPHSPMIEQTYVVGSSSVLWVAMTCVTVCRNIWWLIRDS